MYIHVPVHGIIYMYVHVCSANLVCFLWQVFRFNAHDDRLELCLEPHGHFPVEPGLEARILNTSLINMAYKQEKFPRELGAGSSGVVVGKAEKCAGKAVAFQGQCSGAEGRTKSHDKPAYMIDVLIQYFERVHRVLVWFHNVFM